MDRVERPLSPHLQVYRPQITTVLSILHRASGLGLSAGLLVFVYWLLAVAGGADGYTQTSALLGSGWLRVAYAGWAFCFFYHLANGVRHLCWDLGLGLEPTQYRASGWLVVAVASVVTSAYSLLVIV